MLVTNHVLSGALTGAVTRRPLAAFALGVASHFALDAVPHWGDWGVEYRDRAFLRIAVPDGLAGLAVMGTFAALAPREARAAVIAGMAGAALPDMDKPSIVFFGRSPFPRAVDRFHGAIQREARDRAPVEAAAGIAFAIAALAALLRRPARPGTATPQRQETAIRNLMRVMLLAGGVQLRRGRRITFNT
jgi:hypothetical protein